MSKTLDNAVNWFEIPVTDLDRAQRFYEILLGAPLRREPMGPGKTLAVLPYVEGGVGGALYAAADAPRPSMQGTLIYLNGGASLDVALSRLREAGGRITTPRVDLPEGRGCFVHFEDCEGNRLGLHALS